MSHVTPETARRLKDAGFQQPEPQRGQLWYNNSGIEYVITLSDNLGMCDYVTPSGHLWIERGLNDGEVYAPTATDIMQHLPGWCLSFENGIWVCRLEEDEFVLAEFRSSNPAEAAAEAWFFEQSYAKK